MEKKKENQEWNITRFNLDCSRYRYAIKALEHIKKHEHMYFGIAIAFWFFSILWIWILATSFPTSHLQLNSNHAILIKIK